jgi:hypothetical protein
MFILTTSMGLYSTAGTGFRVAAWTTNVDAIHGARERRSSCTSPMNQRTRGSVTPRFVRISSCFSSSRP